MAINLSAMKTRIDPKLFDPARYGRSNRTPLGRWYWEIDRVLLLLVVILIGVGLIAVAAGSPASAHRYSGGKVVVPELHYFWRQLLWIAVGLPVMLGLSMLSRARALRLSLIGAGVCFLALMTTPFVGAEINGAKRWIGVGIGQFQPSEFLKPFFIVTLAWLLSLRAKDRRLHVFPISGGLVAAVALVLMLQPDFGSTVIFLAVWGIMMMLAGLPPKWIAGMGAAGAVGVVAAYFFYPVATVRINGFLFGEGDSFQVDNALKTITAGGFTGVGPGAGTRKFGLPEAHTDYLYSVIGEEFGLIACMIVAILYFAILARVLIKLLDEEDPFTVLAASGLAIAFALQAFINMAVNTHLAPSKGMTLPFISYGGSSMLALSIGMGLLLAFTRSNPYARRSPYVVKWSGEAA